MAMGTKITTVLTRSGRSSHQVTRGLGAEMPVGEPIANIVAPDHWAATRAQLGYLEGTKKVAINFQGQGVDNRGKTPELAKVGFKLGGV